MMTSNTSHIIISIFTLVCIVGLSFAYVSSNSNISPSPSSRIPTQPWLGISIVEVTPKISQEMRLQQESGGLLVLEVAPGGPADKAGIKGADNTSPTTVIDGMDVPLGGDVIIGIDGNAVRNLDDFRRYLSEKEIGDTIAFSIIRNNNVLTVDATLEERPN
ncbi:MAG TPA: PDZ domain-containing protein [Nitrososphaeraceae archaeon]